ncbi:unnamed protein product [Dovyalis caffra]|uniref:NB-ARC domain-containing protein n=1 Tax=Dovyalis caffra TaxID=77055 RepID=A0AAV1QSA4_9ROSI|nr:unnamed protein product [Dovyalis caffra]
MAAVITVSSLIDKLQALLNNKEVTSSRLKSQISCSIEKLRQCCKLLTVAEGKQSSNQIINIDGLETNLLPQAYIVEDIIDTFVLGAELKRRQMLTKLHSCVPLVSLLSQIRFSIEMKKSINDMEGLFHKQEQASETVHEGDSAGPSISDEQKSAHTTGKSNSNEQIAQAVESRVSDEQPVSTGTSISDEQQVHPSGEPVSHFIGAGPTDSAGSVDQRVSDGQSTQTPRSSFSGKEQAQTVGPITSEEEHLQQRQAKISDHLDEELDFVGLKDEVNKLFQATVKRQTLRFLISVVGAAGAGKTTIVRTVYNRADIVQHFPYRAWVHVSKEFAAKDLLIDMLKQVTTIKDEERLPLEKLQERVREVLIRKRYLIVFDDVQAFDIWDHLKNAFTNSLNGSRVLLTARNKEITDKIDDAGKFTLELRQLTIDESWTLFLKRVRTDESSIDPELRNQIFKKCKGLPLAIVVLGGLLSNKESSSWSKVIERADFGDDPSKAVLALAYQDLPPALKPCLLYLGLFPKEYVIPIRRLFQLWDAEGLVKSSTEESPEDVVEAYFEELLRRNMIEVARWRLDGSPKTCRAPGILYDNVFPNAADSRFFYINRTSIAELPYRVRRVAEYSDISNQVSSSDNLESLRSYISFKTRKGDTPADEVDKLLNKIIIRKGFALLSVLDLEHVYKPILSEAIGKLPLLKYLGLRWTFLDSIPNSVGGLPCLETLDVKHTNITCLPMSIWNSKKLRHLYMNEIYLDVSIQKQLASESLGNLLTLWGLLIGKKKPREDWLNRLIGLRKLALTCHFESLKEIIPWISKLMNLHSLKLRSIDEFSRPSSLELEAMSMPHKLSELYLLGKLSPDIGVLRLPQTLKMLTLSVSKLEKDPMSELGKLPNLSILRLFARSYLGKEMICEGKGFPELRVLKLWTLEELEQWTVQEGSMPRLRELEIRRCEKLKETGGWKRLTKTLKELILTNMPDALVKGIKQSKEWANVPVIVNIWDFAPLPARENGANSFRIEEIVEELGTTHLGST